MLRALSNLFFGVFAEIFSFTARPFAKCHLNMPFKRHTAALRRFSCRLAPISQKLICFYLPPKAAFKKRF